MHQLPPRLWSVLVAAELEPEVGARQHVLDRGTLGKLPVERNGAAPQSHDHPPVGMTNCERPSGGPSQRCVTHFSRV